MLRAGFSTDYIIRIYRRITRKTSPLLGTVEKVGEKGKQAFTTRDELWEILNSKPPRGHKEDERA
jgi:hypothetical protein